MAKLANELSWSRTRMSTLHHCKRQYYYQYYQKWGGWERGASKESQKAYLLSKMTNLPMLVGNAVHDTIKELLLNLRDYGDIRLPDPVQHAQTQILERTWKSAEEERWRSYLKGNPPLFELYYKVGTTAADKQRSWDHAALAIETFLASAFFVELKDDDKSNWLAVDPEPSFDDDTKLRLDGRTIWALPDFARRNSDGECEIWDWKTGSKSPHDELQLLSYALYARDTWGFDPKEIRLLGFYLRDCEIHEYPCDDDRIAFIENRIREDFEVVTSLLSDVPSNTPKAKEDAFPMIDDLATCSRCFFKELCDRE